MKKELFPSFLALVFLFIASFSFGQYQYLKLENKQVYFEKIYLVDSLNSDEVLKLLTSRIPKLKDVYDFKNEAGVITALIKDADIDFRKYGGKWANTAVFVQSPFFGEISIEWKDGKYKVTVSNMYHVNSGFGKMKSDDMYTKKNGTMFSTGENITKAGMYTENYLSDLFTLTVKKDW